MFNLFLIIHAILALTLIVIILLQRSDGGALGGIGGGSFSGMLTGRSSLPDRSQLVELTSRAQSLRNTMFPLLKRRIASFPVDWSL